MGILWPHERYHRITDIDPAALLRSGIKAVVLDVDNTLTTHDNPVPAVGVLEWLRGAERAGLEMMILSNNHPPRVEPFARMLGLAFEANGRKPLPGGVRRACAKLHAAPRETAVIGDQLFTDMLGGRLAGCRCLLVDPIEPEKTRFFRLKRRLERPILNAYERKRTS
ncbi:MAG: YqeG family HAD IIIA-type phosphatase [Oscillospiraceae bacterium]